MKLFQSVFKTMEEEIILLYNDASHGINWLFGFILIHEVGFQQLSSLWLQLKLFSVIFNNLSFFQTLLLNQFKLDQNTKSLNFIVLLMKYRLYFNFNIFIVVFKPI